MFNQVSANIAAQKQAGLFEESAEDFVLVAQDLKGNDVEAEAVDAAPAGYKAVDAADPEKPCVGCAFWASRNGSWSGCDKPVGACGCAPFSRADGRLVIFVKA